MSKSKMQAKSIANELFKRNYILNALLTEKIVFLEKSEDTINETYSTLLITTGKAIYYTEAALLIKELFPKDEPLIYAFPIINTNIDGEYRKAKV